MQRVPDGYAGLTDAEAAERIRKVRSGLGSDLLVLGHHYQRDEVIQFADLRGDSFALADGAARRRDVRWIVFCGVRFMAETADILAAPDQRVILPDAKAGCSMADMADPALVEVAWDELAKVRDPEEVVPITYVNSHAEVKAFAGERGGAVCTSSNAGELYDWAFERGKAVFFVPDEHLGRNMGVHKGIPLRDMLLWDPALELGGHAPDEVRRAKVFLWKGHCGVHQQFTVDQIRTVRRDYPGARVLVHWECPLGVVEAADAVGSTSKIIQQVEEARGGSVLAIGTELHLVSRLARTHPDKTIFPLTSGSCVCVTMNRIDPQHLLWVLDELGSGQVVNEIVVPDAVAKPARLALDRMLEVTRAARSATPAAAAGPR